MEEMKQQDNLEQSDRFLFPQINLEDVKSILEITIKKDDVNKLVTFLAATSIYVGDNQLNIWFNSPSSTGKSYIATEIAKYFPDEDVIEIGYASPTSFYHDHGDYDDTIKGYRIDLSKKLLIFLDQPHSDLTKKMRPILSHDKKEIISKITDKSEKKGLRAKNLKIIGFPTVFFCTADFNLDEQEATRFIILSPDTDPIKIENSIKNKIHKESDSPNYELRINTNLRIQNLKERIKRVKEANIQDVRLDESKVTELFFKRIGENLKPRHSRDIGWICNLIKAITAINFWYRKSENGVYIASERDIKDAFTLWDSLYASQELNIAPYLLRFFQDLILVPYEKSNSVFSQKGLTVQDILNNHNQIYKRNLSKEHLTREILPMLEAANLIRKEQSLLDKRVIEVFPIRSTLEKYMVLDSVVQENEPKFDLDTAVDELLKPL